MTQAPSHASALLIARKIDEISPAEFVQGVGRLWLALTQETSDVLGAVSVQAICERIGRASRPHSRDAGHARGASLRVTPSSLWPGDLDGANSVTARAHAFAVLLEYSATLEGLIGEDLTVQILQHAWPGEASQTVGPPHDLQSPSSRNRHG
jgi:hypothetical protein